MAQTPTGTTLATTLHMIIRHKGNPYPNAKRNASNLVNAVDSIKEILWFIHAVSLKTVIHILKTRSAGVKESSTHGLFRT